MPNRRRQHLACLGLGALVLYALSVWRAKSPLLVGLEAAVVDPKAYPKPLIIRNRNNEYGKAAFFLTNEKLWNPAVLVLPHVKEEQRYLLVAGGLHKTIPTHVSNETVVYFQSACFLHTPLDLSGARPAYRCEKPLQPLNISVPIDSPQPLCTRYPLLNYRIEHDDARLWLTDDGVPLMMYVGNSPASCRGLAVVDARAVVPNLRRAIKAPVSSIGIKYKEPYYITRDNQSEIEKNWAVLPTSDAKLAFYVTLSPHQVYAEVDGHESILRRVSSTPKEGAKDCIARLTESVEGVERLFHSTADMNHLGTPFLRLRMCKRGHCIRASKTVLFGIFNRKRPDFMYDTRALVIETVAPFNQISLSQPLTYAGVSGYDFAFTHNIVWKNPRFESGQLIGYLDDSVLISIGISDHSAALVEVTVEDLLASQMQCP